MLCISGSPAMSNVSLPFCGDYALRSVAASSGSLDLTSEGTLATPPSTKKFSLIIIYVLVIALLRDTHLPPCP